HLIAHNLIRYTMAQAATEQTVPLARISFKGTLDALRQFTHAMSQPALKRNADNCGPNCSQRWPPIWCPNARAEVNPAPLSARKTNTRALTYRATNTATVPNAMFATPWPGCAGSALCKGHSPGGLAAGSRWSVRVKGPTTG